MDQMASNMSNVSSFFIFFPILRGHIPLRHPLPINNHLLGVKSYKKGYKIGSNNGPNGVKHVKCIFIFQFVSNTEGTPFSDTPYLNNSYLGYYGI